MNNYEVYNVLYAIDYIKQGDIGVSRTYHDKALIGLSTALDSSSMSEEQLKDIFQKIITNAIKEEKALRQFRNFNWVQALEVKPLIANAIEDGKRIELDEKNPYLFSFRYVAIANDLNLLIM